MFLKRGNNPVGSRRIFSFRILAILSGLMLLFILELALRIAGVSPSPDNQDPYISFEDDPVLFVKDDSGKYYQTAENRIGFFRKQRFPVRKSQNAFRIFVLGGSTVQGRPYSVETAFPVWLKINLEASGPGKIFEVINCGGVSYASYRLTLIMREVIEYDPDLVILYTGHNEFLEERSYGRIRDASPLVRILMKLRITVLIRKLLSIRGEDASHENDAFILPAEVDARLDYKKGLESYEHDPELKRNIIRHFEYNVKQMILLAKESGVPLILVNPVSNLKDCPPFKSEFRKSMTPGEKSRAISMWEEAGAMDWDRWVEKLALLEKAAPLNPGHAGLFFSMGKAYERLGRYPDAKKRFILAKELDICPLRILEPMHDVLTGLSEEYDVFFVDARELFEEKTPDRIPGAEMLLDHVHPDIEGHQLIADALYEKLTEQKYVRAADDWQKVRDRLRRSHLESLDAVYFHRGIQRMRHLEQWSRGRIPANAGTKQDER